MAACLAVLSMRLGADQKALLGRWNLTGTPPDSDRVYWIEVNDANGKLSVRFLNRGGSPVPIDDARMENDELVAQMQGRGNNPGPRIRLRADGAKATGTIVSGTETVSVTGARPPR